MTSYFKSSNYVINFQSFIFFKQDFLNWPRVNLIFFKNSFLFIINKFFFLKWLNFSFFFFLFFNLIFFIFCLLYLIFFFFFIFNLNFYTLWSVSEDFSSNYLFTFLIFFINYKFTFPVSKFKSLSKYFFLNKNFLISFLKIKKKA